MKLRPPILYPLFADLETLDGVGPKTVGSLAGLNVTRPRDLIFTLPGSGIDRQRRSTVAGATLPGVITVEVSVGRHIEPEARGRPYRIEVHDARTMFHLVFFNARGASLMKRLPIGARLIVSGRVERYAGVAQMSHPDHIVHPDDGDSVPCFEPVYPLCSGLTRRRMAQAVTAAVKLLPDLPEWIDAGTLKGRGWPRWKDAVISAHRPTSESDLATGAPARERLAYDELFAHQITLALDRAEMRGASGVSSVGDGALRGKLNETLQYQPTNAQKRAIGEIVEDMASGFRMNRLVHGDVGSGKTLVAFFALILAVEAGGQGALMAPTETLARQHFSVLGPFADALDMRLEILTGREGGASRAARLESLKSGEIDILVGTHALIQPDVEFAELRLAVVDEQHRFGVAQRKALGAKGEATDMLSMSATPIPRSLALVLFGDMDVSVLDEKPRHRKPIDTALAPVTRMDEVMDRLHGAVAKGRRVYWVCPQIDGAGVASAAAVEERFRILRAALGQETVGLVHGQMPRSERDEALEAFADGRVSVLVSTTVIEVGVDVPEASIMVVERAESFGLAQLHQIRGRVGRGSKESACLLLYCPPLSRTGRRRLEFLRRTDDGFRIAEADLSLRGPGDVVGTAQAGMPGFRIALLSQQSELVALAQSDARRFVKDLRDSGNTRIDAILTLLWLMEQEKMIHAIPER